MAIEEIEFEKFVLPNGIKGEFYPEEHKYFVGGKELPSITTLISQVYGDSYGAVNPILLKRSADYGTAVHEELSRLIELREWSDVITSPDTSYQEVENYFKFIEPIYKIDPIMTERIVVLNDENGEPFAAGRFDMLCFQNGTKTLVDFKTTSTIQKQKVMAQLNLYLKAARDSGYLSADEDVSLGVVHLSGEKSSFKPVPKMNEEKFFLNFVKST